MVNLLCSWCRIKKGACVCRKDCGDLHCQARPK
jgi:hypothetical protein